MKLIPVQYFMLTFTVPTELRALAWARQDVFYELLLRASWCTWAAICIAA